VSAFEIVPGVGVPNFQYESRSANSVLGTADKGKTIDITAAITQTFEADETLGDGWWVILRNKTTNGSTVVTLDPAGSETIDGQTTVKLYSGEARVIYCNGAGGNFNSLQLEPGYVYQELTGLTLITATTEGGATTLVTAPDVVCDGATKVIVEGYFPYADSPGGGTNRGTFFALYADVDGGGAASIGKLGDIFLTLSGAYRQITTVRREYVPSAGTYSFSIRAWATTASLASVGGGAGGSGNYMPAFIKVTIRK
jgi:hypothetical protein